MAVLKRKAEIGNLCVACGCCVRVCPLNLISVYRGSYAVVDVKKCVGCGKCAAVCPASVISIITKEASLNES